MNDMESRFKLYAQRENILKVRVLDHSDDPSRSVFKLEVLKTLSGQVQVGTIFDVSESKGILKYLAPEEEVMFFLV